MKHLVLGLFLTLIGTNCFAQETFKFKNDPNHIDYILCQDNQKFILDQYKINLSKQISVLIKGIHFETENKTSAEKIEAYKALLVSLIFEKAMIQRMQSDLNQSDFEKQFGKDSTPKQKLTKVFKENDLIFNFELEIRKALEEAHEEYIHNSTIQHYTTHKLEHELIALPIKYLTLGSIKVIKELIQSSIIDQSFASATLSNISGKSIISFGKHVLEGALVGTIIAVLTEPLKGGRQSPSNIWLEILGENPNFMINPEWMNRLGSPDHPWQTHCYTIQERTKLFEKEYNRMMKTLNNKFKSNIIYIHENWDQVTAPSDSLVEVTQTDNTKVDMSYLGETNLPTWMIF